jgi:hypothetical protein
MPRSGRPEQNAVYNDALVANGRASWRADRQPVICKSQSTHTGHHARLKRESDVQFYNKVWLVKGVMTRSEKEIKTFQISLAVAGQKYLKSCTHVVCK